MKRPEDLSPTRLRHLLAFAKSRGRSWRAKLFDYWHIGVTHGMMADDESASLRAIRNSMAPAVRRLSVAKLEEWAEDDRYRQAAEEIHGREGELEIDQGATVSRGDDEGAYVQAWVWVPASHLEAA